MWSAAGWRKTGLSSESIFCKASARPLGVSAISTGSLTVSTRIERVQDWAGQNWRPVGST